MNLSNGKNTKGKYGNSTASDQEMIKIVDRKGNIKLIPRPEYEAKKRHRKRHESTRNLPVKEILSVLFILAVIVAVSYLVLQLMK